MTCRLKKLVQSAVVERRAKGEASEMALENVQLPPIVRQIKIARDTSRPNVGKGAAPGSSVGRSNGYGFIEFKDHAHALLALRQVRRFSYLRLHSN